MSSFSSSLLITFFAIFFIWLIVLTFSLVGIFRKKNMPLPVKLFWTAIIFIAPVVGLVVYLLFGKRKREEDTPAATQPRQHNQ